MKKGGVLIIQSLGLGDLVFSLPAVKVLKTHYPGETLSFLTHASNAGFLSLVPEISHVLTYSNKNPLVLARLAGEVRRRNFRAVFVLNPIFRGSLLAWASGAEVRVGYRRDYERMQSMHGLEKILLTHSYLPREEKIHEAERYLDLLRLFGLAVPENEKRPRLVPSKNVPAAPGSSPLVVIHPGAAWDQRCWPAERFAFVADRLIESCRARIIFSGGPGDCGRIEHIQSLMHHQSQNGAGKRSLAEFAALLSQTNLFITNDTGVLHISAALDTPTLALFGPGDPVKVRPLSFHTQVLSHRIACSPCRFQYTNRCENNLCMQQIQTGEVIAAALVKLGFPSGNAVPVEKEEEIAVAGAFDFGKALSARLTGRSYVCRFSKAPSPAEKFWIKWLSAQVIASDIKIAECFLEKNRGFRRNIRL